MTSILTNVAAMTALQSLTQTNKNLSRPRAASPPASRRHGRGQRGLLVDRDHDAVGQRRAVHRAGRPRPRRRQGRRRLHRHQQRHRRRRRDQDEARRRPRARRRQDQDPERNHRVAEQLHQHRRVRHRSPAKTGSRSIPAPPATMPPRDRRIVHPHRRRGLGRHDHHQHVDDQAVRRQHADQRAPAFSTATATPPAPSTAPATFTISTLTIAALTDSTADIATLDGYISGADAALEGMTTAAADLGAVKKRIDIQKDFVTELMDAIERGVGQLVDADMNEESTRLQALQVQAAARHPGAQHRQPVEPEHPRALPVTAEPRHIDRRPRPLRARPLLLLGNFRNSRARFWPTVAPANFRVARGLRWQGGNNWSGFGRSLLDLGARRLWPWPRRRHRIRRRRLRQLLSEPAAATKRSMSA